MVKAGASTGREAFVLTTITFKHAYREGGGWANRGSWRGDGERRRVRSSEGEESIGASRPDRREERNV